jgi:hypothetical protein
MTHDPLCPVLSPQRWDHYPFSCCCELIAKVREDTLAKCIAALKELESDMANWSSQETRAVTDVVPDLTLDQWVWAQRGVGRSAQVLRALQEKP